MVAKISEKDFVYKAIKALRGRSMNCHGISHKVVQEPFKEYFGIELVPTLEQLEAKGEVILVRRRKGGSITVYHPDDLPKTFKPPALPASKGLERILGTDIEGAWEKKPG